MSNKFIYVILSNSPEGSGYFLSVWSSRSKALEALKAYSGYASAFKVPVNSFGRNREGWERVKP